MSRIRVIALSMGLVIAALLVHSVSEAQGPGGGRGGRGGGPGGFGGFGGFGGGFGGGGLVTLATRPGVQAELKLTAKQKTDVAALSQKIQTRAQEQRDRMREMWSKNGRGGRGGRNNDNNEDDAEKTDTAKTATTSKGKAADAKGKLADSKTKTGKASAKGKGAGNAPGGRGGPFAEMLAAAERQRQEDEAALAKILNPTQRTRLAQIDLQQQGPYAFNTPDLQKKLRMTPNQVDDVQGIMEEARNAQRDQARAEAGDRNNRGNGGNRNSRGNGGNGNNNGDQANNGGQGGQGGRGQGGQGGRGQGGQGGRGQGGQGGRGGGQPFDFQKKMQEDPEFKAQFERRQQQMEELRDQMMTMIAGVLSRNQKVAYNKMLGEPFDRAKLSPSYDPSTAPKEEAPKPSSSKKKTSKSKKTA